ncbi:MAG: hypothetical protein B6I26_00840 [Desulfobacteraceae bacterium 4572_130]|nr:MAG: hypothetical protein B6I26_00840 [Desulfobacteraceae bacterium 4572_130]
MKKNLLIKKIVLISFFALFIFGLGCNGKLSYEKLIIGEWNRYINETDDILTIKNNYEWRLKINVTPYDLKIFDQIKSASGTWKIENTNLVLTVIHSEINDIWKENEIFFYEIIEISNDTMKLRSVNEGESVWQKIQKEKYGKASKIIKIKPIVVNLNKTNLNEKDRYLYIDMELNLLKKIESLKNQSFLFHPRAREAVIIFLSSFTYENVKTFNKISDINKKLKHVLNPYFNGLLKNIKINRIMLLNNMDEVNKFRMEEESYFI